MPPFIHVLREGKGDRNWAALSGLEIALSAAIGWGQDGEISSTPAHRSPTNVPRKASEIELSRKERAKATGFTKNHQDRQKQKRKARADKQGLDGSKERDERTEQTERRAARGKSTGKDFFQPRTRASIHETYGFSARLMGTDTRGPIQWELLMMLCWRERPASGYELGELLLATGVVAGNNFGRAGAEWRRGQGRSSVCAARQSFMLHHGTILRKREKDALLGVYSVQCLRLHRAKGSGRLFSPLCYGQRVQVQYRTDRRKRSGNADERHQTAISIAEDLDEPVPEKASEDMERRQGGLGTAERAI
ncbi:hypothetical protein EDB89DRAFT_1911434 [Lactarius sanguifluus]|nr:hypothetical protein EDB89DRAFT_1911434 [Lactarius sanguifluus]